MTSRDRAGRRALVTAAAAAALTAAPLLAGCSSSNSGSQSPKLALSTGPSGQVSASVSASMPSVSASVPSSISASGIQAGQSVTLSGTVKTVVNDHLFVMTTSTDPNGVPVFSMKSVSVKQGDNVTVSGKGASVSFSQLASQLGIDTSKYPELSHSGTAVQADSVTVG